MNKIELLEYYKSINIEDNIIYNRRGTEENVKIKILLPLIEFLGYDLVKNVDFELQSIDIVFLDDEGSPILFIEAKSWNQDIDKYLDQCLEYTFKLKIPFAVIASGQHIAIYTALLNDENLKDSEPIFQFNFEELLSEDGEQLLNKLYTLISKESILDGYKNLYREVEQSLINGDIEKARKSFFAKCLKYKPVIKTNKITDENFEELISLYPTEIAEALHYCKEEFVRLTDTYSNLRLRYRSKEVGIEYIDNSAPRQKILGLLGIYPEKAQIMFGMSSWQNLAERKILTKRIVVDKLKKYDGHIQNIEDIKNLIDILEDAFENINN